MFRKVLPPIVPLGLGDGYSRPWGDGLVGRSLTTLWYPVDWGSVSDDELALFMPALAEDRSDRDPTFGPQAYLRRVLQLRATEAARLISAAAPGTTLAEALDLLWTSKILTQLAVLDFQTQGTLPGTRPHHGAEANAFLLSVANISEELIAVARIDRLLADADANSAARKMRPVPIIDWPLSLTDVLISTVHARLNGAYVYPVHAYAHEILTVAAVLGHLLRGRAVLIAPDLADTFIEALSFDRSDDCPQAALQSYAETAYGSDRLCALCKRARTRGYPVLAKPRPTGRGSHTANVASDTRVAQRIRSTELISSYLRVA
jgi:hypothetical protein